MKVLTLLLAILLAGCATVPGPEQMRSRWTGGNEATFNRDYAECRMKANEVGPGVGTHVMTMLIWPIGLGMGITGAMQAEDTMKLCMAARDWSPVK
jgi:hypothetical protein